MKVIGEEQVDEKIFRQDRSHSDMAMRVQESLRMPESDSKKKDEWDRMDSAMAFVC